MIYLDNSATTQPCAAAILSVREMLETAWHNPSAPYALAVAVEKRVEAARAGLARALGVPPRGVVFTASGTEADSLAILGTAQRLRKPRKVLLFAAEHPAVRETAKGLEAMGHQVAWMAATPEGLVDLDAFEAMLDADVALVSCMHVGNETGAVQPLAKISALLRAHCPQALLHADGVQGFLRLPMQLPDAGVDLYTISAHKIHGPKGVGALVMRPGVRLEARVPGGGQEHGLRSGTENTAGIAGLDAAVRWVQGQGDVAPRLRAMKLALYGALREGIDGLRVNGPDPCGEEAAPHILNVSLPGVGGEVMLHALEAEGVLVGTGAACSSKARKMSAAFEAMGAPKWAADSAIRFSMGLMNTMDETAQAAQAVLRCYARYKAFQRR